MKTSGMGRLIGEVRKEVKLSGRKLCQGLCSVQLLSKIEMEERTPDILLLEALMQRLGMSPEKLEIILTIEEYEHIESRDELEDALRFGRLEEAEEKLNIYLKKYAHEGKMQRMYGLRMRGAIAIERGAYAQAATYLDAAAAFSIPSEKRLQLKKELLSAFEIENLILLCQAWSSCGKETEAREQLEVLYTYVKEQIADEEEQIKLLSKIVSILGMLYNKMQDYRKCIQLCEPILELEREQFLLQAMTLLMDNLILAYEKIGETKKAEKVTNWREHLEAVFYSQGYSSAIVNGMYFNFYARQYYLDCELIRGERLRQGLTQAELCRDIYECPESLSRVENGKASPNRIKFAQLMERLGMDKTRYNGHVATNEYRIMELDAEIERLLSKECYEEAKKQLEVLEQAVDLTEIQNMQLIERRKSIFLERDKKLSPEEFMKSAYELLSLTFDFTPDELRRIPFRNEVYLS